MYGIHGPIPRPCQRLHDQLRGAKYGIALSTYGWLFGRGTGLRPDLCKVLRDKTGPGGKGDHTVRLEITEFIDDQLEVVQDVRKAHLAPGLDLPRLWLAPRAFITSKPNYTATRRQASTTPGCTYACHPSVIHDALAMTQWLAYGAPGNIICRVV